MTESRLDQVSTHQSLLRAARQGDAGARAELAGRYFPAVRRYLGRILPEADADDVAQDIFIGLFGARFSKWDAEKGKFRNYLKTAVRHEARRCAARKQKGKSTPVDLALLKAAEAPEPEFDRDWLSAWEGNLLGVTMGLLRDYQREHPHCVWHTALRLRMAHAEWSWKELAEELSKATGHPFNADSARKQLLRARHKYAELLLAEICRTLGDPSREQVWEELIELNLMEYVKDFLPVDWRDGGDLARPE